MRPAYGESFANKLEQLYNALERIDCKVILLEGIHLIGMDSARHFHPVRMITPQPRVLTKQHYAL